MEQKKKETSLKNVNVQITVTVFLCIMVLSGYFIVSSYNNSLANEERNVKERLKSITATAALQIDGDIHQAIYKKYPNKDDIKSFEEDSSYNAIHKNLVAVKKANGLNSEIYTAVYEEETNRFMMGVTSAKEPFYRHEYKSYPDVVIEKYYEGGALPMYEDEYDTWLSAFTPLKNSKGDVVAIIQTDVTFTQFIVAARKQLLKDIVLSILVLIVIAGVMFISLRTILKRDRKAKADLLQSKLVIQEKQTELLESINYAKRIQAGILPSASFISKALPDSFVLYKPKDIIAGDFFWVHSLPAPNGWESEGDTVLYAAADCTGHGVPGAMVSVICSGALDRCVQEFGITEPGEILTKARELVIHTFEESDEIVKDGMDVALCSLQGKKLSYAGANNPLWIVRNGELIEYKADKQAVGETIDPTPFKSINVELESGDVIYTFSDGYIDQFGGPKGKKFKSKSLKALLVEIATKTLPQQKEILDSKFEEWRGNLEQIDDVCLIGVKV